MRKRRRIIVFLIEGIWLFIKIVLPPIFTLTGIGLFIFGFLKNQYRLFDFIGLCFAAFLLLGFGFLAIILRKKTRNVFNLSLWFLVVSLFFASLATFTYIQRPDEKFAIITENKNYEIVETDAVELVFKPYGSSVIRVSPMIIDFNVNDKDVSARIKQVNQEKAERIISKNMEKDLVEIIRKEIFERGQNLEEVGYKLKQYQIEER